MIHLDEADVAALQNLLDLAGLETPVRIELPGWKKAIRVACSKRGESGARIFAAGEGETFATAYDAMLEDMRRNA